MGSIPASSSITHFPNQSTTGPVAAALWFLQYLAYQPDATSFSAAELCGRLCRAGFDPQPGTALIPGVTTVILARKQVDR